MDFNKWIFDGVSYINAITEREWDKRMAAVEKKEKEREDMRAERETKGPSTSDKSKDSGKSKESKSKDSKSKGKDKEKDGSGSAAAAADGEEAERRKIVLSKADDITFVAEAVKKLEAWIADSKAPDE
jgi:hypothetical protein